MSEKTYWNGEPAKCRRVMVRVAERDDSSPRIAWWSGMEGTIRAAVEVDYGESLFYLDDDDVPEELHAAVQAEIEADPFLARLRAALPERLRERERNKPRGLAGDGWAKVTKGKGGPDWGHRSLPVAEVLGEAP